MMLLIAPGAAQVLGKSRAPMHIAKRKKGLKPEHFKIPARAVHIPSKTKIQMGTSHKRLICLGADLVDTRQQKGIGQFLKNIKQELARCLPKTKFIHNVYLHMWDEVNTRLRPQKVGKTRAVRKWSHQQVIMQKGALASMMKDLRDG